MIADLDVLLFSELEHEHPERYQKASIAGTSVIPQDPGQWVVRRDGADESHIVRLVQTAGHPVGKCSCPGYEYHSGPCSHLAVVWRMEAKGLLEIPRARLRTCDVEIPGDDEKLQQWVDNATAATDGGVTR